MKTNLKSYQYLILLLIIIFYNDLTAVDFKVLCPPCSTNCEFIGPDSTDYGFEEDEWFHELLSILNGSSLCYFEVYFRIRKCECEEGTRRDIIVEKIEVSPGCNGVDYQSLISEAIRNLVKNTPTYFNLTPYPANGWAVNILIPTCWKTDNGFLVPCTQFNNCCVTEYRVAPDGNDNYILTYKNRIIPSITNCSGATSETCTYSCDANDLPYGEIWTHFPGVACSSVDPCPTIPWDNQNVYWTNYSNYGMENFTKNFRREFGSLASNAQISVSTKNCPDGTMLIIVEKALLSPALISQGTSNYDIILSAIKGALWRANGYFRQYLNPNQGQQGPKYFTVILPACWHRINNKWLIPCPSTLCCSARFTLNYDPNIYYPYGKTITFIDQIVSSATCESNSGCDLLCSILNDGSLLNAMLPRVSSNEILPSNLTNPSCFVEPNPANNKIDIGFISSDKGFANLIIYNNMGDIVFRNEMKKESDLTKWQINTSNFSQGIYSFNILIQGKIIAKNSFIIIK